MSEVTVVLESYNLTEASSVERLRTALRAATATAEAHGDAVVFVTDVSGDPELAGVLEREFPAVRRLDARGLDYDGAKLRAAEQAESEFVVYLDGDCIPEPGWLDAHLAVLRGGAHATSGFTRYDGGWAGAFETVLDFGFMLPAGDRVLGCYGSNNAGFRRETLLAERQPDGPMRCRCYAHAQALLRRGTPVRMVPAARVRHERVPFLAERYRRGFEHVAACWVDPALPEARWLRFGLLAAPVFYARTVVQDWQRLAAGWRDLDLAPWQALASAPAVPVARLIDLVGITRALVPRGRRSGGLEAVAE